VTADILMAAGYKVVPAKSPDDALALARTIEPLHLLLTDVVMPGMNGRQLAEQLLAAKPGTRVLFMSGYTDDVVLRHGVLDSEMAFLQKPITPAALLRKVTQVLGSRIA
jgi:CheY-like chemotaxis protein